MKHARIGSREELKGRELCLYLTDTETRKLFQACAEIGMTPERLLTSFICDLVFSRSNGSDEREAVRRYIDRCGFRQDREETFITYLADRYDLDYAAETMSMIQNLKEELKIETDRKECWKIDTLINNEFSELRTLYYQYRNAMHETDLPIETPNKAFDRLKEYTRALDNALGR